MEKITDKIYVETGYLGNNVGVIITQEGLILIESPMLPDNSRHWKEAIKKITDKKFAYLINTHHHFDHVIGNYHFECPVIAHKNAMAGFEFLKNHLKDEFERFFPEDRDRWEADLPDMKVVMPQITFSKELFLNMGDCVIEVKFVGGHCASSLSVYVPSEKTVFAGDNLDNEMHPFLGQARLSLWTDYLKGLLAMEVDTILPGHGPVGSQETARKFLRYLEEFVRQVKALKEAGCGPEETAEKIDILDFFAVDPKERGLARRLITEGAKAIYAQVLGA